MAIVWAHTAHPVFQSVEFGNSSVTFTDQAIGTASADRIVVVAVTSDGIYGGITYVSIAGTNGTLIAKDETGYSGGLYQRLVTTGTTATIIVTYGSNIQKVCGIQVGTLTGATETPTDTEVRAWYSISEGPAQFSSSITIPTGGFGLCMISSVWTANKTVGWTNATEDYYSASGALGNQVDIDTAHSSSAGAWSPSVTGFEYKQGYLVGAAWEPAAPSGPSPGAIVPTITL